MVINIIFVLAVTLTFLGLIYCYHILIATSLLSALLYFSLKRESIKTVTINFLILFSSIFLIELYFFTCAAIKGRGNKDIFTIIDRNTKEEINNSKSYTTTVFDELGYHILLPINS
jgi:aminopeptidase-like protein